jgi:hypothetical protein
MEDTNSHVLSEAEIQQFIENGFVKIEHAFPAALAERARVFLWKDAGCERDDRTTWTRPVVRLGMYTQEPFLKAANTPVLHAAFDQLVGRGTWRPCMSMGTFPVRFPSPADPGDTGWHIDASFDYDKHDFMEWRANVYSRGRALLMLFLFSDIGEHDAPTRIKVGSHSDIARALAPAGEAGLTLRELNPHFSDSGKAEMLATGEAGTVYLCHPFLVHSAQMHQGSEPRFLAQPPLLPRTDRWIPELSRSSAPVPKAIAIALEA